MASSLFPLPLRISFNLGDDDLRHFEEVAQQTQASSRARSAGEIVADARRTLEQARRAQQAEFVKERFSRLERLIDMALDEDWPLGPEDSQRLLNALACFGDSTSDAPANFLDHAIMVELVSRDLEHDLAAYRDFCRLREKQLARRPGEDHAAQRNEWLAGKRAELQSRMHERRRLALDNSGSSVRRLFSLFGL